ANPSDRAGDLLEVLRMKIPAADDEEVFLAAADVEVALVEEAQVARAQPARAVALDERRVRRVAVVEVSGGERRAPDPDLADRALCELFVRAPSDPDRHSRKRAPVADEGRAVGVALGFFDRVRLERAPTDGHGPQGLAPAVAGRDESVLGEAV